MKTNVQAGWLQDDTIKSQKDVHYFSDCDDNHHAFSLLI
jgi:hypothetical protein